MGLFNFWIEAINEIMCAADKVENIPKIVGAQSKQQNYPKLYNR